MLNSKIINSLDEKLKNAFYGSTLWNASLTYVDFLILVPNYDAASETIRTIVENWKFENREELEGFSYTIQSGESLISYITQYKIRIEKKN